VQINSQQPVKSETKIQKDSTKSNLENKETPVSTSNSTKDVLKLNSDLKKGNLKDLITLLDSNEKIIKSFTDSPVAPYTKETSCRLDFRTVVENTSLIKDFECSNLYEKSPSNLAKDILSDTKLKEDPELKSKVLKFLSLLNSDDKAILAYTKNILDRNPPISNEITKNVFDSILTMMNSTYDNRIPNTKDLVISSLHDISMPTDISQEEIGTCAGTSVQIQLAMRNPVEYLKMIDTLAKNKPYISVSGKSIPPNFTFTNEGETTHDTKRTISSKIIQNSIMDYADGDTRNFDSSKNDSGLDTDFTAKALNDIVGLNVESLYSSMFSGSQLVNILSKSNISYNNPVEISMEYQKTGRDVIHSVNVVSMDSNNVTIVNPWGREETFPIEALKTRIMSVSHDKSIDKGIMSINISDDSIKNDIIDNNKKSNLLSKMSIKDKANLIENAYAPWDNKSAYKVKENISENDKKMIINILDDLTQSGPVQNKAYIDRIKHFAPDINLLLTKIDNGTEQYTKVKEKIVSLNT
jgi:hypothetical protein